MSLVPLEKDCFHTPNGMELPYRLFVPKVDSTETALPLVLFLHGAGERGNDNEKHLVHGVSQFVSTQNQTRYPCYVLAPQCPEEMMWVDVDWHGEEHQQPGYSDSPGTWTISLIHQLLPKHPIDPKRIYITGLSMGGFGTWDLLARHPELFAAGVPICGGGDLNTASQIAEIPIWAFHGAKDTIVKPFWSRNMIAALEQVGGKPRYTEYPDVEHHSWEPAYQEAELFSWLFAQRKD